MTGFSYPVHVKGVPFSVTGGHAAQGDGEVYVTALQTLPRGTFQLTMHKDMKLPWPRSPFAFRVLVLFLRRGL